MKKKISFLLVCILTICIFAGCGKNFLSVAGKNCDEYTININLDEENHTAKCSQSVSYINNTGNSLDELYFHLYDNAFSATAIDKPVSSVYETKAYYNGFSEGKIDIENLKVENEDCAVVYDNEDKTLLRVELKNELKNKERVKVSFEYSLVIPNVNHRFGYGENTINLGNFYPIASVYTAEGFDKNGYHYNGDPFYSNMANYKVNLTLNNGYTVATTGYEVGRTTSENKTTCSYEAIAVRDFALVISDKFTEITKNIGETLVKYYYYGDEKPEDSLNTAGLTIETFNKLFGTYPYSTLSVVESNFVHGGMEFPNLVLISDALDNYDDYTQTIVHEIAHQWWYGIVGNNEYNHGWLDEGLAEYSTALFFEQNPSYGVEYDTLISNAENSYCLFEEVYTDVFGNVDTTMDRKLNEYNTEPEYVYIAYVKGMLMFDGLREIIGTKKFMKGLQVYYNNYQGKNAVPQNLIDCFEKSSGTNLESFFDSWINGKVVINNNA